MSNLDRSQNQLRARIVYWGPAGSGKTTTLASLHRVLDPERKFRLYRFQAPDGSTLPFDMLPLEEFSFAGVRVRLRLFAAPGAPERVAVRSALLREADAVVFVGDSSIESIERNRESLIELEEALQAHGRDPDSLPIVWCFNRQDVLDTMPVEQMTREIAGEPCPAHATVAPEGQGVFDAFREVFAALVPALAATHGLEPSSAAEAFPETLLPQLARRGLAIPRAVQHLEPDELVIELPAEGDDEVQATFDAQIRLVEEHAAIDAKVHLLQGRNRELMAANRVARSILNAMEAENLLVVLLDSTAEHLGASHAGCVVFDGAHAGRLYTHVLGFGRDPILGLPDAEARRFFELMEHSDGPIAADPRHHAELLAAIRKLDTRIHHALIQPIKDGRGRPSGWIGIYSIGDEAPLSTQSLLFLSSISRLAALGLDKIALLNKVQDVRARMEGEVHERTSQLEMANAKIRKLNLDLEARVAERTRALEEANIELKEARAGAVHGARLRGMGHVAAAFAHEVNNPVAGLRGNLDLMKECLDELRARVAASSPDGSEGLHAIAEFEQIIEESRDSADRIVAVIGSLKRFGGEESRAGAFQVNAAVADAVTLLEERLDAHAELELKLGRVPDVGGDAVELSHVVLELVTNALEAVERTGRRGVISVTTFHAAGRVTLAIRDTGCGIPEVLLPHVFDPFVTTKEGEPNAGLGLHCAYKAAQRLGGELRLRSRPERGTTVTLVMPVGAPARLEDGAVAGERG